MRLNIGMIGLMLSATALALPMTGCAGEEVVYDPYRHDYHRWNSGEDRSYRQWETGTRRGHMAFQSRSAADQRAYWDSRHK